MRLYENNIYLEYIYGATGIIGFDLYQDNSQYETRFWFVKNIQGDVTHIYNGTALVAEYSYDAWGNHTVTNYTVARTPANIGDINPIRYRGYYYDAETGLYYLKSRYYDPETGRFISMDDIDEVRSDVPNGLNFYAYCGNNPVMNVDPNGNAFFTIALITALAVGAVVGGGFAGHKAYEAGYRGAELVASTVGGALLGASMGAALVLGGAAAAGALPGMLTTAGAFGIAVAAGTAANIINYSLVHAIHSDKTWTFGGAILSGMSGALQGLATFGVGYGAVKIFGLRFVSTQHSFIWSATKNSVTVATIVTPASSLAAKLLLASVPAAVVRWVIRQIFGC